MNSVKISIIVAVNNGAKELRNTLDSIKSQTLKEIEVIMADASSTDATAQVMKEYTADKRFSFISCDTVSISASRNLAIKRARGKYVAFADSNVTFSKDVMKRLFECAEKEKAEMCIAPMIGTDVYGQHTFSSSGLLSKRRRISKFDTDIIWNPAVTNKLFLKSKIDERQAEFRYFGKAREAAFTIPFAFESERISSCSKGWVCYISPVINDGVSPYPIENYLDGYSYIISAADEAFAKASAESKTDFEKKELEKLRTHYIDEIYRKEVTVLLYSYYRHFWLISDEEIKKYAAIIMQLISALSPNGRGELLKKNKDIFYNGRLIDSKAEMAKNPKVTIAIAKNEKIARHYGDRLEIQLSSIFSQTMPCFELLVDGRLKDIFPEKWKHFENIRFIDCESMGECKNLALEQSSTDYIMFQDGFARLNTKLLMRHYLCLAGKDKYGFSTSPLSKFDGERVTDYSFTELCYSQDMNRTRVGSEDFSFALDLFFANKLFRTEHLKGIRFNFSDSPITDMYKLYTHSGFRKLSNAGAYLPYDEHQVIEYFLSEKKNMPSGALNIYSKYRMLIFRNVTLRKARKRVTDLFGKIRSLVIGIISRILTLVYTNIKIKDRVFFYSTVESGRFIENLDAVYNKCDLPKVIFRKKLPHSLSDVAKIRKYLLTSKVIVLDCEMEYLRGIRLRNEQKVIQLWHKNGAFRRFGLDKHSNTTLLKEYKNHSQYSAVTVTSEHVRQFYSHAFGIDIETVKALGGPGTDITLNSSHNDANAEIIKNKHPLLKNKRVYVYFPTYRENEGELTEIDPKIDWAKLNRDLADDEIFIVSRHPLTDKEFFGGVFYSRVKDYTKDPTSELLSLADVIITDYSSVVFDAALLGKPMVFYCSDFGEFEPDFYLDYEKDLPGEIIKDSDMLLQAIRRAQDICTKENLSRFRRKYMGACDGKSTDRIINLIEEYLK